MFRPAPLASPALRLTCSCCRCLLPALALSRPVPSPPPPPPFPCRNACAKEDLYYPHPLVQDMLWWALYRFGEPLLMGSRLRAAALKECMKHIHYEV